MEIKFSFRKRSVYIVVSFVSQCTTILESVCIHIYMKNSMRVKVKRERGGRKVG